MMMDRRTFIQATALVTAAPVLANLLTTVLSHASPQPDPMQPQEPAVRSAIDAVTFKIDGWDLGDPIATEGSKTSFPDVASSDPVLIRINQTWRTAWR